jgi:hypothetical protein
MGGGGGLAGLEEGEVEVGGGLLLSGIIPGN